MRAKVLGSLLFLSFIMSGCVGGDDAPATTTEPEDPDTGGTETGGTDTGLNNTTEEPDVRPPPVKELRTAVTGLYPLPQEVPVLGARFEPAELQIPKGTIMDLTFTNSDRNNAMVHALKIPALGNETASLGPTQFEIIRTLIELDVGEYEYFCKNHPPGPGGIAAGKLIVTEV